MTEQATQATLAERLVERFGATLAQVVTALGETTIEVAPENLIEVCTALRDEPAFRFACFVDVCGVDYLHYGQTEWDTDEVTNSGFSRGVEDKAMGRFAWEEREQGGQASMPRRFASVLHLLSIDNNCRIRVKTFAADSDFPVLPSVTGLWSGANWFERESFDLFGIVYEGHPDLRRILTDYGFVGHPFRKDFPLIGNVEVRYDPVAKRVVYEPVSSVQPRVTVPRVIRNDHDLDEARSEAADRWWEN